MRLKRLCRPPRPYHRFRVRHSLRTSNPRELLNCRLLGLTSISVQGILRSSVYTAGDHFQQHEKSRHLFLTNGGPAYVLEPLLFDFGSVNSIAGLGLAGLDVELVLFGGGG